MDLLPNPTVTGDFPFPAGSVPATGPGLAQVMRGDRRAYPAVPPRQLPHKCLAAKWQWGNHRGGNALVRPPSA